jgi:hypothetical protein
MKTIAGVTLALFAGGAAVASAPKVKKEEAVAACLWEVAPVSTVNYLKLPAPQRHQGISGIAPEYALRRRLDAACLDALLDNGVSRPREVSERKLRAALEATRPAVVPTEERDPKAFVCTRFFENDTEMKNPAEFRWGYGDDFTKAQFETMSFIFAAKNGGGLGLAKDGGLSKCQFVQPDGSLKNA